MGAALLISRRVFLTQGEQRGDIGVGKLIDFWNRRPGLHHAPAHRAP